MCFFSCFPRLVWYLDISPSHWFHHPHQFHHHHHQPRPGGCDIVSTTPTPPEAPVLVWVYRRRIIFIFFIFETPTLVLVYWRSSMSALFLSSSSSSSFLCAFYLVFVVADISTCSIAPAPSYSQWLVHATPPLATQTTNFLLKYLHQLCWVM